MSINEWMNALIKCGIYIKWNEILLGVKNEGNFLSTFERNLG